MSRNLRYVSMVLVGGAVGALAGLLLAPAPGRETRRRLTRRISDDKEALFRRGNRACDAASDYLQGIREAAGI